MAELGDPILKFRGGCPDCGERHAVLPIPIPGVANDFDWKSRDYDSFRLFMMQELAYRFPERRRWTPADMEAVIVELLAAALDRASHALDAVQAERYLESARRPQSVRRLLKLIGYDAVQRTDPAILGKLAPAPGSGSETDQQKLERYWRVNPAAMEKARHEGPRLTGEVRRMVTLADHESLLEEHPLVSRARARLVWSGAWNTILIAALLENHRTLDDALDDDEKLWNATVEFHRIEGLPLPSDESKPTARQLLRIVIEQNRMVGSEVFLEAARSAPISFDLSVQAKNGYFRSEVKQALHERFTAGQGGFFEPGRLGFGEDLFASDIIEAAMAVEGVGVACLNRFKRVGAYPDRTVAGVIEIADNEFVLCANNPRRPKDGTYRIVVNAGELRMTLQAPDSRDEILFDLSRWNRAGLPRFQYVDGDAAVWLEELRIAMMGLFLRGINPDDRVPEKWRDVFLKPEAERQLGTAEAQLEAAVTWKDLWTAFPVEIETCAKRNQRLREQYDRESPDYAWEVMRAFARAAHIVLGYQDAYANEGYLRTATQWDNLRKLAAMVNYQPTPPASATSTIALEPEPGTGTIEVARGLAMKYTPPEGGAPLIFETLKAVVVHPGLSPARTKTWNHNRDPLDLDKGWNAPEKAVLAPGDLAVMTWKKPASSKANPANVAQEVQGLAASLRTVERHEERGPAILHFAEELTADASNAETGDILLLTEPDGVQLGLPRTSEDQNRFVVKTSGASRYSAGAIVNVRYTKENPQSMRAIVVEAGRGHLTLQATETLSGEVQVEPMLPFEESSSKEFDIETPKTIGTIYYKSSSGKVIGVSSGREEVRKSKDGEFISRGYMRPDDALGWAYALVRGKSDRGKVVTAPTVPSGQQDKTVRFEGAPPKSLKQDAWYIAREVDKADLVALKVSTIRMEADVHYITFATEPPADPDKTEFFGPMTQVLRPVDYDRDQRPAIVGGVAIVEGLSAAAQDLVKVGRAAIVTYGVGDPPLSAFAVVTSVERRGSNGEFLKISMQAEQDFSDWKAGWTKIHLNTVGISHGETRDPKVLGSGDAENRRQSFRFKTTDVSFVPSSVSGTGVAPDMDVTVDGVKWEFRDLGDPKAEDKNAWSVALNDDNTLQIHFRRRLPTGTNNVAVARHRTGVGAKGTGIPPWSFAKPMKKNRFVARILQPFTTAGGADRESVSDIRKNAPSKLAANGRAVSLKDFGQLCNRHSSVWQARAREVIGPGATNVVDVVVVPAKGGKVGSTLERDLIGFIKSRALPNTRVTITNYQSLAVRMHVKVNVDARRYERSDVQDAVEAGLFAEFALSNRALGQPIYVGEIYAAAERIDGVSSVTITDFSTKSEQPKPLRKAEMGECLVALFPTEVQVAVLNSMADVTVDVEGLG